jgi:putative transposase
MPECLNMEWFRNPREAAVLIEAFRVHYNKVRPHSSLGHLTPEEFRATQAFLLTPTDAGVVLLQ